VIKEDNADYFQVPRKNMIFGHGCSMPVGGLITIFVCLEKCNLKEIIPQYRLQGTGADIDARRLDYPSPL
jgi:hypothetical protein